MSKLSYNERVCSMVQEFRVQGFFFGGGGWDGGLNMLTRAEFFSYADIRMNANIRETCFHYKCSGNFFCLVPWDRGGGR